MANTINYFSRKYGKALSRSLGMEKEDIENDMREQIWKGLLTHKKSGKANLKTYLNTLITNRFNTLLERSGKRKYNAVEYHAQVFDTAGVDNEYTETDETPESLLIVREEMMQDHFKLSGIERKVYIDIKLGASLQEMEKRHGITREQLITIVKRIDILVNQDSDDEHAD